jgi:hypothetical protein
MTTGADKDENFSFFKVKIFKENFVSMVNRYQGNGL